MYICHQILKEILLESLRINKYKKSTNSLLICLEKTY